MIGQTLAGKYQLVRLLGEGGMASVFEASHQRLHQRVAIKMLAPELARDAELVARFEREARAVAALRTRHVARVMDVDSTPDHVPYIVMEFLEGRDLDAELEARSRLPAAEAVDYVLQACAAMTEAHAMGIVHRDLKPANLFLSSAGTERVVKVLDFGISKFAGEATRLTGVGAVMGTVLYMSPEQVRAQSNVDARADIWSLGVILYELVAGRAPWEGSSQQIAATIVTRDPPDLRSLASVPEGVAVAVQKMMQRDPNHRYANVRQVLAALAPFAPPGSIGGVAADQEVQALAASRNAMAGPVSLKKTMPLHTVPYMSMPPVSVPAHPQTPEPARVNPRIPMGTGPHQPPSADTKRAKPSSFVAFAAVIGVLGAAGIVLIVVAMLYRRPHADGHGGRGTLTAEPPPSATADVVAPASASASAEQPLPLAPPTGTNGASSGTATPSATVSGAKTMTPTVPSSSTKAMTSSTSAPPPSPSTTANPRTL